MVSSLFNTALYEPLYNGLVFLIDVVPAANAGVAVVVLTLIVKFLLFPLSHKAVKTQRSVREIEPEIGRIRERFKNDKQEQARHVMNLYRKNRINPLSGFLIILIQLPIIFALYWVFFRGGLPDIDPALLYSFTPVPEAVNMHFLWVDSIANRSFILALLAGITQYVQMRIMLPTLPSRKKNATFKEDLARSFNLQMRYVMPVVVVGVAYVISAAIALYWTTSNLFAIGQELLHRKEKPNSGEDGQSATS